MTRRLLLLLPALGCAAGAPEPTPAPLFAEPAANPVAPPEPQGLRFVESAGDAGLRFMHMPGRSEHRWMPETNGGGLVVADFTRDGAPDVLLVNGGLVGERERPVSAPTRFFVNLGDGRFEDRTAQWGLRSVGYGQGAAAGDVDNDGYLDLVLTHWGRGEQLLLNRGDHFVDVTDRSGLPTEEVWSSSAAFFDADRDGTLDLYVARYVDYRLDEAIRCYANRVHVYCKPTMYESRPDRFYRGLGQGRFVDASEESGVSAVSAKGLALATADIDLDGDVDVYVANDLSRNLLWLNRGDGTFEEVGRSAGVAYSEVGAEEAGMGADVTDVDGDGRLDIVCTNFQGQTNSLYTQRTGAAGLFFQERSDALGIGASARARLAFGVDFVDADNDGDEDLLVANGHINDNVERFADGVTFEQPNSLYRNDGGRFTDVSASAGTALTEPAVGRGLATGDLDGDGDLDFVVANNGGPAQLGRNETRPLGNFVSLWLEGTGRSNRSAIGAVVRATAGGRTLVRQVQGAQSYLATSDLRVHLGLGSSEAVDVLITWPDGTEQREAGLEAGRFYRVVQGLSPEPYTPGERVIPP